MLSYVVTPNRLHRGVKPPALTEQPAGSGIVSRARLLRCLQQHPDVERFVACNQSAKAVTVETVLWMLESLDIVHLISAVTTDVNVKDEDKKQQQQQQDDDEEEDRLQSQLLLQSM